MNLPKTRTRRWPCSRHSLLHGGCWLWLSLYPCAFVSAEVLHLRSGGQVEGTILRRPTPEAQPPQTVYIVKVREGTHLRIEATAVAKVEEATPVEADYAGRVKAMADTAEAHEALARWCLEHDLTAEKEFHWRQVLRLDPDHAEARRVLGYQRVRGEWMRMEEINAAQGYVIYKGSRLLPQQVAAMERKKQQELQEKKWRRDIVLWRSWLGGRRDREGRERLQAIQDPMAAWGIVDCLGKEDDVAIRDLYLDILSRLDSSQATQGLIRAALEDDSSEIRERSVQSLRTRSPKPALSAFTRALLDRDSQRVNRAGAALGQLGDRNAVVPLIDRLITSHESIVAPTSALQPTFGASSNGGGMGGLSVGGGPKKVVRQSENKHVLEALIKLTGQNFHYDMAAWKAWYRDQQALPADINLRRDP